MDKVVSELTNKLVSFLKVQGIEAETVQKIANSVHTEFDEEKPLVLIHVQGGVASAHRFGFKDTNVLILDFDTQDAIVDIEIQKAGNVKGIVDQVKHEEENDG